MHQFERLWKKIVFAPFTCQLNHYNQQKYQELQINNLWRKYKNLNSQLIGLYKEIEGHNAFWCKYLTVNYLSYVVLSSNFFYVSIFTAKDGLYFVERAFFCVSSLAFFAILLLVTWQSSLLVYGNCKLHKQAQRMALLFHSHLKRRFNSVGEQLKVDAMTDNYESISKIDFKLLNSYPINSRMFEMVYNRIIFS